MGEKFEIERIEETKIRKNDTLKMLASYESEIKRVIGPWCVECHVSN